MIRISRKDLLLALCVPGLIGLFGYILGSLIGGVISAISAKEAFFEFAIYGAIIGGMAGLALVSYFIKNRYHHEEDFELDLRFTLKLIIALGATGAASAAFDTLISGPRIPGGIIPYVSYAALFGAGLGLIMGIYWNLREKKLPLRD